MIIRVAYFLYSDHSIPIGAPNRIRDGTVADLLACATDVNAKILSATRLPSIGGAWNERFFSTDYVAWRATEGMPFADGNIPLPTEDFHFGRRGNCRCSILVDIPPTRPRYDSEDQDRRFGTRYRKTLFTSC